MAESIWSTGYPIKGQFLAGFFFFQIFRDVIEWRQSRTKLYWRLKRRLHEKKLMGRIENTGANLNHGQKTELLRRWFTENEKSKEPNSEKYHWEEDQPVAEWLENQIKVSFDKT